MQLIAIGELLKKVDLITNHALLKNYSHIEWKKVKGLRDIISHHYFDVNAEAIFDICENKIPELDYTILQIIRDVEKEKDATSNQE